MASDDFASRTSLDWWRPMGQVVLSGRSSAVLLMEPAPDFPAEDRKALEEVNALLATDQQAARALLREIVARHPEDEGLRAFAERCTDLDENGVYVMAGK